MHGKCQTLFAFRQGAIWMKDQLLKEDSVQPIIEADAKDRGRHDTGENNMCKQTNYLYIEAFKKMREASFQSHSGHWDSKGTHGANCPECARARDLRKEADSIFERAQNLNKNIQQASAAGKQLTDVYGASENGKS